MFMRRKLVLVFAMMLICRDLGILIDREAMAQEDSTRHLLALAIANPPPAASKQPGPLLVAGGGTCKEVKETFVELAGGNSAVIAVVTYASADPVGSGEAAKEFFDPLVKSVTVLLPGDGQHLPPGITGVWICGGAQKRLMKLLKATLPPASAATVAGSVSGATHGNKLASAVACDTETAPITLLTEIAVFYRNGGAVGATSAGAAAAPRKGIMDWLDASSAEVKDGMDLVDGVLFDTHTDSRPLRHWRLWKACTLWQCIGFALPESSGVIVLPNGKVRGIGLAETQVYNLPWRTRSETPEREFSMPIPYRLSPGEEISLERE